MDIQNIKYNSELMKTKSRLEKELRMVNRELATQRDECEHIRVILDCEGEYEYQRPGVTDTLKLSPFIIGGKNLVYIFCWEWRWIAIV